MRSSMIFRTLVLLLLFGVAGSGCGILDSDEDPRAQARALLDDARDRWGAADVESYEFLYQRVYGEGHPDWQRQFLVRVEAGEVVEILDPEGAPPPSEGDQAPGGPPPDGFTAHTIPELFDLAEDALESADQFTAHYDAALGYPTLVSVDPHLGLADDEFVITAMELVPLP